MSLGEERLHVPAGFRNLLESLTVAVLRDRPGNIPQFAAEFFQERLVARQKNGYDECLLGSQIDGYYNYEPTRPCKLKGARYEPRKDITHTPSQNSFNKPTENNQNNNNAKIQTSTKRDVGLGRQNEAATKIQAGYHGYVCRKERRTQNEAAVRIQSQYRGYHVRKAKGLGKTAEDLSRGIIDESTTDEKQVAAENGLGLAARDGSVEEETAATKIQAHYRGYKTRATLKEDSGVTHKESSPQLASGPQDKAATCIQAGYRGYRDRKEVERKMEASTTIQAGYRGYRARQELRRKEEASTTIQAAYRGHRTQQLRRAHSEAAAKIQAGYRGYAARRTLKQQRQEGRRCESSDNLTLKQQEEGGKAAYLTVQQGMLQNNSRYSFSLPSEDVQFEADLDSDSDVDIDKIVEKITAIKTTNEEETENGDLNQV